MNFPSRVRVVKKIPSTGRVASTRHSLLKDGVGDDEDDGREADENDRGSSPDGVFPLHAFTISPH